MTLRYPQFYAVAYEIQGYEPNLDDDLMRGKVISMSPSKNCMLNHASGVVACGPSGWPS